MPVPVEGERRQDLLTRKVAPTKRELAVRELAGGEVGKGHLEKGKLL